LHRLGDEDDQTLRARLQIVEVLVESAKEMKTGIDSAWRIDRRDMGDNE
jgi:hypothetical protein